MEQCKKIVLEAPEGMHYSTSQGENGELIIRLVPNSPVACKEHVTCSQGEAVEKSVDKAIHFTKISAEDREKVKTWLKGQKSKTDRERKFLTAVKKAVQKVNYDYWIANLEPSVAEGKIYYAKGENVGVGFSCDQYKQMAEEYAPERGSRMAKLHELLIWYALRIVNGLWTLHYVANDSSSAGNYWNAPNSAKSMEKTGSRDCGGYSDGQGNTYKIITVEDGYALVGGYYSYDGYNFPVAYVYYDYDPYHIRNYGSGVLVLTK